MFDISTKGNLHGDSIGSLSQTTKLDKTRRRSSRWDSDSDTNNEPKTPRHETSEPKTPRRDAIECKTPRYVNPYDDEDIVISPKIKSQHRDQIYNKFELTEGDEEELEDVPWRKSKSDFSKRNKSDNDTVDKTAYGKWFDFERNRSKEEVKQTSAMETDELLDENYPNVKPSAIDKSSFRFSSRTSVKLFMEEKNKKSEKLSQQHVFALDDSPVRSPVEDRRVLDDDVIIVPRDILDDTTDQSLASKQVPPSESRRIPVLGARVNKSAMTKQSRSTLFLPPVSASGPTLYSNQSYCPPTNFVGAYPSDHNNVHSFGPPSVGSSTDFFIETQSTRPVQPVEALSFNNFTSVPPPTRSWIPSTNPTLPSPSHRAAAPSSQYHPPTNLQMRTEVSTLRTNAITVSKDAVKEEIQQQNRNLLMQKQEYVQRLQLLTDEMAKLKGKKKEILEGRKTQETEQFLKENNRLQSEIQSKITAVENVIDMLSNMIAKNGGEPKIELKNSDSQKDPPHNREDPKDNNSHKNKKAKRDRHSRSRSPSRRQTRSRSPKSRARSRARKRSPSESRSRSRSRRRSKSKLRHKSLSHSPKHRSRRSRSQDRHHQRQHTPEKRSKSISVRKNEDQKSSSSTLPLKRSSIPAQIKVEGTLDKRRETHAAAVERDESKSQTKYYNVHLKTSSNLSTSKVETIAVEKKIAAETITLEKKTACEMNQQKQINYVYYDPETHWCRVCNVFPQTAKEYLTHLHSIEHKTEMTNRSMVDYPWHKVQPEAKKVISSDAAIERVPIRGLQFFVSATAWYCKLCNVFMGDLHCASVHLKSDQHQQNLSAFLSERPSWEDEWLRNRTKAYEEYTRKLCDSQADVFTCALPPSHDTSSQASTAPAAHQPPHNTSESKDINLVNGDLRNTDTKLINKDELKNKHLDRNSECSKSKGRERFESRGRERSKSRARVRSRSCSRERSRGRNRSKGRDHSRDRSRSRDRERLRGRERSRNEGHSHSFSDHRERPKRDKSISAFKYHESGHSKDQSSHSKESSHRASDNAADAKISIEAEANQTANDDKFVKEWIPSACSSSKEKEFADLRDKLRRKKEDEKNRGQKDKKDESSKDLKRHADVSPFKEMSSLDEKRAKKTNSKSKNDQQRPVKMQPIVIGKGARFPFIGKMPSRSSRKSDPNATTVEKVAKIAAAADEKLNKVEEPGERTEREPDTCNTIVDMDVNDIEDVPIVTEIVDEIAIRKKDFDETLKILYPEEKPLQQEPVPLRPAVENGDRQDYLLSLFRSTMLETMKQLPNQKGSFDTSTVVDLVTTMSKTLLTVGQNVQNSIQLSNQQPPVESDVKLKRVPDRVPVRKRIEIPKPTATENRGLTRRKNAMSQKRRRSLRKVREKLQEQEKQLQEKIDETKKNLAVESISTPPEGEIEPESIPMPAQKSETHDLESLIEPKDDCDLMLLGIEEGDSAALRF